MLTDKEIQEMAINIRTDYYTDDSVYQRGMIEKAIRAALELDAQKRQATEKPRKPWPDLPVTRSGLALYGGDKHRTCFGPEGYAAAAFALNTMPKVVAWVRRHQETFRIVTNAERADFTDRDVLLARIDAAGFDFPEKA